MADMSNGNQCTEFLNGIPIPNIEQNSSLSSCSNPDSMQAEDGGDEASTAATVVVESIMEEIVSFISEKSVSVLNDINTSNPIADLNADIDSEEKVPELTEIEPESVIEDGNEEIDFAVNITLDESGNYVPPANSLKDSGSNVSSCSSIAGAGAGVEHIVYDFGRCHLDVNGERVESKESMEIKDAATSLLHIQMLIDENNNLQQQFARLKRVLALVMSRYRNSVVYLLNELDVYKKDVQNMTKTLEEKGRNFDPKMEVFDRNATIAEMKRVMFEAARLDDITMNAYEEKVSQLRYENEGLRKIIRISLDYGGERLLTNLDKAVQTDDVLEEVNIEEELASLTAKRGECLDVYSSCYEYEDDKESFHTANSLNGSTPSLNQEPDGIGSTPITNEVTLLPALVANPGMIGDQDKVEFNAEEVNNALLEVTLTSKE